MDQFEAAKLLDLYNMALMEVLAASSGGGKLPTEFQAATLNDLRAKIILSMTGKITIPEHGVEYAIDNSQFVVRYFS